MKKIALLLFLVSELVTVSGAFTTHSIANPSHKRHHTSLQESSSDALDQFPRGGASVPKRVPDLPTMTAYRKFAWPCLGLWVMGPLLSLVDTSFVGLSGTAAQSAEALAALGPATTFIDGATYLFAFLNVATTNLYSSARAQTGDNSPRAESVVRTAARVSLICGFCLMGLLLTVSRPLLAIYIGPEAAAQPNLLNWATDYVRWRALSMPTSLLLGVLQAALLGAKDAVTPLVAVGWSMGINIFGDYLLVTVFGMGLRGAAIATTLAQWGATLALIGPARKKLVKDHDFGLTSNKHKKIDVANRTTSKAFLLFAGPVLTLILGKLAAFGFMTNAAAGLPGQPTTLASHQIILSTFFFISPFLEVISQTAQTFLPAYIAPVKDYIDEMRNKNASYDEDMDPVVQPWQKASFQVASRLMAIGLVVASMIATVVSAIPALFPNVITSDPVVQETVKPLAKYLWAGAFLTAPVAVSEGVLLAKRELPFLATVYLVSSIVLPFALIQIKRAGAPVSQVWGCFALFQMFRATMFAGKIWGGALASKLKNNQAAKKLQVAKQNN